MDLTLLKNHIDSFVESIVPIELAPDGSNAKDFFCADVVGGKDFVQNFGGYPRSEIAEINEQTNIQLQAAMLQKLEDYSQYNNPNAGKTDAEIALSHKSRYQQTATEMQSWLEGQLQIRDAKMAAMRADALKKAQAAQPKQSSPENVVNINPE